MVPFTGKRFVLLKTCHKNRWIFCPLITLYRPPGTSYRNIFPIRIIETLYCNLENYMDTWAPFLLLILLYALTEDTGLYYFILLFGLAYGLTIVYFVLKKMKLYNIVLKENYSNTDNVNVRWLTTTSILLVACMFAWTITSFYVTDWGDTCYYFFCCYIWGFISFRTKHQEIASREFFDEPDNSYEQNNQSNNEAKQNNVNSLILKLEETLSDKKLYHNPRLTLLDTAKELGTNRTYLSSCLNNELHTTFYDYINSFSPERSRRNVP